MEPSTELVFNDEEISWWHGNISFSEAKNILQKSTRPPNDSLFLVRESESMKGGCILAVNHEEKIYQYKIQRFKDDAFFGTESDEEVWGLENMIRNLQSNSKFPMNTFVKNEPPPDLMRATGRTNILHKVVKMGNLVMVKQLLDCGYKFINAKDDKGKTAIHHFCENKTSDPEILRLLIKANAHADTFDSAGNKPIHYACQHHSTEVVQILIDCGVNLQRENYKTGYTPLHEAARGGNIEVVKLLLKNNVPVRPRSFEKNEFPVSIAANYDYIDIVKLLNSHVSKVKTIRDEWFHSKLDRKEAEQILKEYADKKYEMNATNHQEKVEKEKFTSGTFLVRTSEMENDLYFVISVIEVDKIMHYKVYVKGPYHFLKKGPFMDSLEHLIEFYTKYSDPILLKQGVPNKLKRGRTIEQYPLVELQKRQDIAGAKRTSITRETLSILKELGNGQYGTVHLATCLVNNRTIQVAVKTLNEETSNRDEFFTEAKIMMTLHNPNIVKILGVLNDSKLMIIQEFMPIGSLLNYLKSNKGSITNKLIIKWGCQIACGMNYLESQKIVHRDLAARNILMQSVNQVKISDFGLSRALATDKNYYKAIDGGHWPVEWYAPESYLYGEFAHSSDVWSYGVTLWEIYSDGDYPYAYEDLQIEELCNMIADEECLLRLIQPKKCPCEVYAIMRRCWEPEPLDRINFQDLVTFFDEFED